MIPEKNAPPFPGYVNEYFSFEEQTTIAFFHKSKELEAFFLELKKSHKGEFMAYTSEFVENNYTYIRSGKMFCFHLTFMIISVLGFVISVQLFGSVYGREWFASIIYPLLLTSDFFAILWHYQWAR